MNFLAEIFQNNGLGIQTSLIRLLFAFVAGTIIGLEREAHRQPAGLKTHILIAVGSTLIMLLSIYMAQEYSSFSNADPGRIAAQVVSGIGFIGAGAILRMGINVRGLTTAASIWSIAAIGLAIGAGMYLIAAIAIFIILFVLIIVEQLERRFFTPLNVKILTLNSSTSLSDELIRNYLQNNHYRIIDQNAAFSTITRFTFTYKIGSRNTINWGKLTNEMIKLDNQINEISFSDPTF